MSLVNDMLRDLDRRRQGSDGSGSPLNLMPATEAAVARRNRVLLIALIVLAAVAVGLGLAWSQLDRGNEVRTLDIRPAVPVLVQNTQLQTAEPEISPEELRQEQQTAAMMAAQSAATVNDQALRNDTDSAEAAVITTARADVENVSGSQEVVTPSTSTALQPGLPSPAAAAQPQQQTAAQATAAVADNEDITRATLTGSQAPAVTAVPSVVAVAESAGPDSRDNSLRSTASEGPVPAINQPAPESVKDFAQMSPEELDTQAVQTALKLIAYESTQDAYTHLEQHIINNRYAHQSRETYAKLLMNDGHLVAAFNLIEDGLGLAPNHPGFKKVKARILIADGQVGAAVELLEKRAPAVGEDLEYHEILATAQLASRDYAGALISYTGLVQQDRNQGKWWYGYAASQDNLGNRAVARQAYGRAVQQQNLSPNLRRRSQERLAVLGKEGGEQGE